MSWPAERTDADQPPGTVINGSDSGQVAGGHIRPGRACRSRAGRRTQTGSRYQRWPSPFPARDRQRGRLSRLVASPAARGEPNSLRSAEVGRGWRRCPRRDLRQALKFHGVVGKEGIVVMTPDKKRQLEHFRWLRDHAEEAAGSLRPGDIRTPEKLRHGAQQMIDLIEKGQIPRRRK